VILSRRAFLKGAGAATVVALAPTPIIAEAQKKRFFLDLGASLERVSGLWKPKASLIRVTLVTGETAQFTGSGLNWAGGHYKLADYWAATPNYGAQGLFQMLPGRAPDPREFFLTHRQHRLLLQGMERLGYDPSLSEGPVQQTLYGIPIKVVADAEEDEVTLVRYTGPDEDPEHTKQLETWMNATLRKLDDQFREELLAVILRDGISGGT
jgi:hypothetical protein